MSAAWQIIAVAVLPLWIIAGFADWLCHRRTHIQATLTGTVECKFHWLQFCESGLLFTFAFLFEMSWALLFIVLWLWWLHELTTYIELRTVVPHRYVAPAEQMIHSLLELLPLAMTLLLATEWWTAPAASDAVWRMRVEEPMPWALAGAFLAAILAFNVLPLIEESWRCWAFRARTSRFGQRLP